MGCMMSLRFLLEKSDLIAGAHYHGGYLVTPEAGTSVTPSENVGVYMTGGDADDWFAMSEDQFDVIIRPFLPPGNAIFFLPPLLSLALALALSLSLSLSSLTA